MLTTEVENYPGLRRRHHGARTHGLSCAPRPYGSAPSCARPRSAGSISPHRHRFPVWVGDPQCRRSPPLTADALIIATGARSLMLGTAQRGPPAWGTGSPPAPPATASSSANSTSPWPGAVTPPWKRLIFLTRFATKVTVDPPTFDELRASKIMQERAFKNPKIEFLWDSVIVDVLGDTKVSGVKIQHTKSAETFVLPMIRALRRHRPRTQQCHLVKGQLDLAANGYVRTLGRSLPAPASTGYSPVATSKTTTTARRSPPPARVVWRRSTPNIGWKSAASSRPYGQFCSGNRSATFSGVARL